MSSSSIGGYRPGAICLEQAANERPQIVRNAAAEAGPKDRRHDVEMADGRCCPYTIIRAEYDERNAQVEGSRYRLCIVTLSMIAN